MPTRDAGVLDTSVYLDLGVLNAEGLPSQPVLTAITMAELHAEVAAARDEQARASRQEQLTAAVTDFDPLPFDGAAAARYGTLVGLALVAGRLPRGRRLDLMIAATASSRGLPVYTRNPTDFVGLDPAVEIVAV